MYIDIKYLANESRSQNGLCDPNAPLKSDDLGKVGLPSSSTFKRWVKERTLDNKVENKFSAVKISKPSSSSSSPELTESLGSNSPRLGLELL